MVSVLIHTDFSLIHSARSVASATCSTCAQQWHKTSWKYALLAAEGISSVVIPRTSRSVTNACLRLESPPSTGFEDEDGKEVGTAFNSGI